MRKALVELYALAAETHKMCEVENQVFLLASGSDKECQEQLLRYCAFTSPRHVMNLIRELHNCEQELARLRSK